MLNKKKLLGGIAIAFTVGCTIYGMLPKNLTMTQTYTVQSGDTLWDIATKYNGGDANTGEVEDAIQNANHLESATLQPGQELRVPSPSAR